MSADETADISECGNVAVECLQKAKKQDRTLRKKSKDIQTAELREVLTLGDQHLKDVSEVADLVAAEIEKRNAAKSESAGDGANMVSRQETQQRKIKFLPKKKKAHSLIPDVLFLFIFDT